MKQLELSKDFNPSYSHRKRCHDYYAPFIYHIIIKKNKTSPEFGEIVGNSSIKPGNKGCARVNYSKMGYAIFNALKAFPVQFPELKLYQYSIMPDHLHLILYKIKRTEIHLEDYIKAFKRMVAEKYKEEGMVDISYDYIFQHRFTDKLLFDKIRLDDWIKYVAHNPHRRATILQYPDFFKRINSLKVEGETFEAFGNSFLMTYPDKFAVRVRRNFTLQQIEHLQEITLELVKEGTVIVSPFISSYEKEIRQNAERLGAKIILIRHEVFPEKYKPPRHEFKLCSEGRLLIISLGLPIGTKLTYEICTRMNELAERIYKGVNNRDVEF